MWGASTSRRFDLRQIIGSERFRRRVLAPAAVASLVGIGIAVTASPLFRVHRIQVLGEHHLRHAAIVREAGLGGGSNVFWLDTGTIEARLEDDPWVASARVSRRFPSTIVIRVRERRPAGQVEVGTTWLLVAGDGVVLGPSPRRPDLPVLPSVAAVTAGAPNAALAVPARVAGGLAPSVRRRVSAVFTASDGDLLMRLDGGTRVLFGPASAIDAKDRALAGIVGWMRRGGVRLRLIDLRAPLAPAARLVAG